MASLPMKRSGGAFTRSLAQGDHSTAPEGIVKLVASAHKNACAELTIPLAVFILPEVHRKRLRTSNLMERAIQQEVKRRTARIRIFPSQGALLRLVTAILVEIDDGWAATERRYINWNNQHV